MRIGFGRVVDLPYAEALARTEEALEKEGFGIITRVDVKATMKEKLGVDFTPFVILGACNPPLAHRALEAEPEIGLMLPCNVVVRQVAEGKTRVEAVDATAMASLFPSADLAAVADEVGERLTRVLASV
jgi:uncharacterized protein (DUF302 family)